MVQNSCIYHHSEFWWEASYNMASYFKLSSKSFKKSLNCNRYLEPLLWFSMKFLLQFDELNRSRYFIKYRFFWKFCEIFLISFALVHQKICQMATFISSIGQFFCDSLYCCLDLCHIWLLQSKHRILSMRKCHVMIYVYA